MNRMNWQRYQIAIIAWFESQPIELQSAFPMNRWRSLFRLGSKGRDIPFFDAEEMLESMLGGDENLRLSLVEPLCAHLNQAFGHQPPADSATPLAGAGVPAVPEQPTTAAPEGAAAEKAAQETERAAEQGDAEEGVVFPGFAPGGSSAFAPNPLAMLSPYDMPWVDDAPPAADQERRGEDSAEEEQGPSAAATAPAGSEQEAAGPAADSRVEASQAAEYQPVADHAVEDSRVEASHAVEESRVEASQAAEYQAAAAPADSEQEAAGLAAESRVEASRAAEYQPVADHAVEDSRVEASHAAEYQPVADQAADAQAVPTEVLEPVAVSQPAGEPQATDSPLEPADAPSSPLAGSAQEAAIAAATAQSSQRGSQRAALPIGAGYAEPESDWNFPEYDFSRQDLEPLVSVRSERTREGLRYTWRDAADGEVYRVVVETGGFSTDVDLGRTVGWTKQPHVIDPMPADSPCRFITVWGYEDLGDGELGQCRRVAAGLHIAQVENIRVEVAGSTVRAQWEVPGAPVGAQTDTEVVVARLPGEANVGMEIQTDAWLNHTLASNMYNCLDGFDDSTGMPGQRYVYLAAVKVRVGERFELGRPTVFRADLQQAPLAKPQHFTVSADVSTGGNVCTLTWQAVPGTRVRVFRTTRSPHSAAAEQPTVGVEQLVDAGLRPEDELHGTPTPAPGQEARGIVQLTGVEWPDGAEYDRLYFTPVAIRDGLASVGRTQVLVRSGEIADVRLVQRLDWQLLTFAWPGEAASVQLRRTAGQGPVPVEGAQAAPAELTCTRQEYSRQGGFVITGGDGSWGRQLQLNAVSYHDGEPIFGRPALVDLDPLYRFEYHIEWPAGARAMFKRLGKSKNLVRVTVRAVAGTPCPPELLPHLMLVHNPHYLPLHWRDGAPVPVSPAADGREPAAQVNAFPAPADECEMFFPADQLESGYVRLMVCAEPESVHGRANTAAWAYASERYALVDPDAHCLQVEH